MKIKANGHKIKIYKLINTIVIIISSIITILGCTNRYSLVGGILFAMILLTSIRERKLINSRCICFSEEEFEWFYIYLGSSKGRKGGERYTLKYKSFHLRYDEIKEYGNIKDLSQKFHNNRVYNIGFITKNNIKCFIYTNEYSEEDLKIIIENLQKRIKIKPVKEIEIKEKTYKTLKY